MQLLNVIIKCLVWTCSQLLWYVISIGISGKSHTTHLPNVDFQSYKFCFVNVLFRLEYIYNPTIKFNLAHGLPCWTHDHAIAQAISHWLLIMESRVQPNSSLYEICGWQSGTGASFSASTSVFPASYFSLLLHSLFSIMQVFRHLLSPHHKNKNMVT
jgi:hypothetical protein